MTIDTAAAESQDVTMSESPQREVAHRVFAREFNAATHTFRESDKERAPVYALLPTGEKVNRVFVVGTLTETDDVGDDSEYWRGRLVDPIGTFFIYAGSYQLQPKQLLSEIEPPKFVAAVGKPRTYETDTGAINVSLQPESLTVVDKTTRDRWVVETAMRTSERISRFDANTNPYAQMAHDQYDISTDTFKNDAIDALQQLAGAEDSETIPAPQESDDAPPEQPPAQSQSKTDNEALSSESNHSSAIINDDIVVSQLQELGDGTAVHEDLLIETISNEFDVSATTVESAIDDALENGRCVRSDVDELMPI